MKDSVRVKGSKCQSSTHQGRDFAQGQEPTTTEREKHKEEVIFQGDGEKNEHYSFICLVEPETSPHLHLQFSFLSVACMV